MVSISIQNLSPLEPEKITQYEAGITHQVGNNTAIEVTAYYKDVQDQTQIFHQSPAYPQVYDYFANSDYGTIKGIDFELAMRRTRNLRLDLKYTLSWATGTGSYAQTQYNVAWQNPLEPPKTTAPLDYDQRHNIVGIIDFRTSKSEGPQLGNIFPIENMSANAIVQIYSGTPYTPMNLFDAATEAAVNPEPNGHINSRAIPWGFNIDLKVERKFKIGEFDVVPYVWVQNLLDRENVATVYESSGKPDVTGWLTTLDGQEFVRNTADDNGGYFYELKERNPRNYAGPRVIMFGLRMAF